MEDDQMTEAQPAPQADYRGAQVNAKRAQRPAEGKAGDYICGNCQTQFHYEMAEGKPECPSCHTTAAETLTPIYTEDDPKADEMLGKDEFSAGD
jgi:protein-arginine kinase activator protein McsA